MATTIAACGFECGEPVITTGFTHHITGSGAVTIGTASPHTGLRYGICGGTAAGQLFYTPNMGGAFQVVKVYVRFPTALPASNCSIIGVIGSTDFYGIVFEQLSGKLFTGKFSSTAMTIGGATGVVVVPDVWYALDISVNSNANPWLVDGKVDGVDLGRYSPALAALTTSRQVRFGRVFGAGTYEIWFDDFVRSATLADYPLPDIGIRGFIPTADGTHNIAGTADFRRGNSTTDILNSTTTAWQLVAKRPLPTALDEANCIYGVAPANPTTDYVEVAFGNTGETAAPIAVDVITMTHQVSTANGSRTLRLNDNGTVDDIIAIVNDANASLMERYGKHYAIPPSGGVWNAATSGAGAFNNLKLRFLAVDAAPDQAFDAVMLEAVFPIVVKKYPFRFEPLQRSAVR